MGRRTAVFEEGCRFLEGREYDRAIACFRRVPPGALDHPGAVQNLSLLLLLTGRTAEGWALHEGRPAVTAMGDRLSLGDRDLPRWDGTDLRGRRLLLTGEQGFGDQIQFMRFVPHLAQDSRPVDLAVAGPLTRLAQSLPGVGRVLDPGLLDPAAPLPLEADCWIQMMSLPHILRVPDVTALGTRFPYLRAQPDLVHTWHSRLVSHPDRPRVGLFWSGNPTNPDTRNSLRPASLLERLLDRTDVTFVNLQKAPADRDLGERLPSHSRHLCDFAQTAAALECLDLLITVDTAVAHLAGALGREVWTLLTPIPDWRWGVAGSRTPWYPSMRLFRPEPTEGWGPVVGEVDRALTDWLAGRASGPRDHQR